MKLESLKSSKFEAFKENEIQNTMKIVGGQAVATVPNGNFKYDSVDDQTTTSMECGIHDFCLSQTPIKKT